MELHNLLAQSQSDAASFVLFLGVQTLENLKNALSVFRPNADPVVRKYHSANGRQTLAAYINPQSLPLTSKLDRVGEQVGGDLAQSIGICPHRRQVLLDNQLGVDWVCPAQLLFPYVAQQVCEIEG